MTETRDDITPRGLAEPHDLEAYCRACFETLVIGARLRLVEVNGEPALMHERCL